MKIILKYSPDQPRDTSGKWTHTGGLTTDFQGRPLKDDRKLMGGNLTHDEKGVMEKFNTYTHVNGKEIPKHVHDLFIKEGIIAASHKGAKSYDQYYHLTTKGQDLRSQLYNVQKRIATQS